MEKRIIYKSDDGGVNVIIPSQEALESATIEELAKTIVPKDTPYKIVSSKDIPEDRTFRGAWEYSE